jgi:hypothetical protein
LLEEASWCKDWEGGIKGGRFGGIETTKGESEVESKE